MEDNKEQIKKHAQWLNSLLTGWGLKQSWAKVLTGAIIGAIIALLSGCTWAFNAVTPTQTYSSVIEIIPVQETDK